MYVYRLLSTAKGYSDSSFTIRHKHNVVRFISDGDTHSELKGLCCDTTQTLSYVSIGRVFPEVLAFGAALAKYYNLDADKYFTPGGYVPNLLVFKTLLEAFGIEIEDDEMTRY